MKTRFLPSRNGFRFANRFQDTAVFTVNLGFAQVPVGSAANGLCAGMVHAALDLFRVGRFPPPAATAPGEKDPLFLYIASRQMDTLNYVGKNQTEALLNLAATGLRWWASMDTAVSAEERFRTSVTQGWPTIKRALDAGIPVPIVLIRGNGRNVEQLKKNHCVLAYDYEEYPRSVELSVYDPNFQMRDNIELRFYPGDPAAGMTHSANDAPIYAFGLSEYTPRTPPQLPEDKPALLQTTGSELVSVDGSPARSSLTVFGVLGLLTIGAAAFVGRRRRRHR